MGLIFALFWIVFFAMICRGMARDRGLDPVLWTFLGGFFGIFAVLLLALKTVTVVKTQPTNQHLGSYARFAPSEKEDK
jgi:hypothetical protein